MNRTASAVSLLVVALLSAVLWRFEVEWHGWEGLLWINYFHLAIPVGILLFAGWLAVFSTVQPIRKRLWFSAAFVAYAAVSFYLVHTAMIYLYSPVFIVTPDIPPIYLAKQYSIFLIAPMVPVGYLILARLFGTRITFRHSLISLILFACAFPAAIWLLEITNHRGHSDILHAIKSGYVIPFLVASLGSVFVFNQRLTDIDRGTPPPSKNP